MEGALLSPDYMLLDGDNMCHRRFHALHRFSSSDGLPTGMVFGMVNSIFSFQLAFPNAKFIACFDKFGSQGKNTTSFQQKRPRKPPAFYLQMRILREILPHMGVACVDKPGYEADQLLATLAKRLPGDKLIVSEDKDLAQCVTPHVRLYQKPNKKWVQIDEAAVIERYGVPPKKIADYLALAGDPADNIPGVYGIGEASARTLLRNHISAMDVASDEFITKDVKYQGIFTPEVRKQLAETLKLTTLPGDVDIPIPSFPDARPEMVHHIFLMLGLKVAAERLKNLYPNLTPSQLSERDKFLLEKRMHEEVFRDRYIPSPPKPSVWDTVLRM